MQLLMKASRLVSASGLVMAADVVASVVPFPLNVFILSNRPTLFSGGKGTAATAFVLPFLPFLFEAAARAFFFLDEADAVLV
jgi:hypothetical protein